MSIQTKATDELAQYEHGRVPRDVRRRQIVRLAGELFDERGYHGASMGELARRAGVSKPVIYDLFGSKEELYRASTEEVMGEASQVIAEAVLAEEGPEARLRAGAVAAFKFAAKHERASQVLFSETGGPFAGEVDSMRRQGGQLVSALLAEQFEREGRELDPLQVEALGHAVAGAFQAVALWWRDHPDLPAERLADWLVAMVLPGLEQLG